MKKIFLLLAISLNLVACGEDPRTTCTIVSNLQSAQTIEELEKAIGKVDYSTFTKHDYMWQQGTIVLSIQTEDDLIRELLFGVDDPSQKVMDLKSKVKIPKAFKDIKAKGYTDIDDVIDELGEPMHHFDNKKVYRVEVTETFPVAVEVNTSLYKNNITTDIDSNKKKNPCK